MYSRLWTDDRSAAAEMAERGVARAERFLKVRSHTPDALRCGTVRRSAAQRRRMPKLLIVNQVNIVPFDRVFNILNGFNLQFTIL